MSKNRSTKIGIPDHEDVHIEQENQYGVVWPDGTVTWQQIDRGIGQFPIHISAIVPGAVQTEATKHSPRYWSELLEARAAGAKLPVDEYRDMHGFLQRTVILSVTAAQRVQS